MINVCEYTSTMDPMGMTFVYSIPFFVGSDTMRWTQIEVWWYLVSTWAVFSYFSFPFCRFQCLKERLSFWKDMTCHISILLRTRSPIFVLLHVSCSQNWWMNPKVKKRSTSWRNHVFNASEPAKWLNPTVFHCQTVQKHPNRPRLQSPPANPWFKNRHTSGWYWPWPKTSLIPKK